MQELEQKSFQRALSISSKQLSFHSIIEQPLDYPSLDHVSGIILGGSGDLSLTQDHTWYQPLTAYIREASNRDIPILGICFGHQFLGRLLGARVVSDSRQKEVGTVSIILTESGRQSPLFHCIPSPFLSIAGHNDSVVDLPPIVETLASNAACGVQAFKVRDRDMFGVQFHPEMTTQDFRERIAYYRNYYIGAGVDIETLFATANREPTHDALLKNFRELSEMKSRH